jgi:hypothetical protein
VGLEELVAAINACCVTVIIDRRMARLQQIRCALVVFHIVIGVIDLKVFNNKTPWYYTHIVEYISIFYPQHHLLEVILGHAPHLFYKMTYFLVSAKLQRKRERI